MRFLPNSRASIDQAPGPIIARLAPRTTSVRGKQGIADTRQKDPQFNNSNEHSCYWSPQADEEKHASARCDDVRSDYRKLRCSP
jgi:hypothetical protein